MVSFVRCAVLGAVVAGLSACAPNKVKFVDREPVGPSYDVITLSGTLPQTKVPFSVAHYISREDDGLGHLKICGKAASQLLGSYYADPGSYMKIGEGLGDVRVRTSFLWRNSKDADQDQASCMIVPDVPWKSSLAVEHVSFHLQITNYTPATYTSIYVPKARK